MVVAYIRSPKHEPATPEQIEAAVAYAFKVRMAAGHANDMPHGEIMKRAQGHLERHYKAYASIEAIRRAFTAARAKREGAR